MNEEFLIASLQRDLISHYVGIVFRDSWIKTKENCQNPSYSINSTLFEYTPIDSNRLELTRIESIGLNQLIKDLNRL